jgi:hypothetical protein
MPDITRDSQNTQNCPSYHSRRQRLSSGLHPLCPGNTTAPPLSRPMLTRLGLVTEPPFHQCSGSSLKCDRREPCSHCIKSQVECVYPGLAPLALYVSPLSPSFSANRTYGYSTSSPRPSLHTTQPHSPVPRLTPTQPSRTICIKSLGTHRGGHCGSSEAGM